MDEKIEQLSKALFELKEELSKNVNQSYASQPNMIKDDEMNVAKPTLKPDIVKPDTGYGKVTVKDTNPGPADPKKPGAYGKVIVKEELYCSENGQWKIMEKDAKDPKLAPKDIKVKQLQQQIDSGTYKPDAGKIADKIIQHPEKPLK